ncbi:hypothetical protein [Amycolatopsis suaedae]|uniref:Phage tail protein n=1 Tax=Amycolatopsis suaedae TaxID=2510978 RepID=A0A4Q7IZD8_9PSEU|nr:hypothetical protein [Amycolatopsis suaedae]RZQ59837.1 hypothetical protein EWH70_32505 [Amycolatopsis suaedae]
MATLALLNEFVSINGVNLSDHVRQGTLALEATALDSTAMGDGWNETTGGLKSGTLTIELLDDFAASNVDATLWPLFGTVVPFIVRPDAGPVSATNPNYTGTVFIAQHTVGGSLNEMAMKSLSFNTSGVVSRATS